MTGALQLELLTQITKLLDGGQAHATLEMATSDMPLDKQGVVPAGLPYSAWQLLEHIRIAQRDILEFSDNEDGSYKPMQWPQDYWPNSPEPPDAQSWQQSVNAIQHDRATFEALLRERDLTAAFAWGDGQNLLREAFLIADHAAYHLGELVTVRRALGCWKA